MLDLGLRLFAAVVDNRGHSFSIMWHNRNNAAVQLFQMTMAGDSIDCELCV